MRDLLASGEWAVAPAVGETTEAVAPVVAALFALAPLGPTPAGEFEFEFKFELGAPLSTLLEAQGPLLLLLLYVPRRWGGAKSDIIELLTAASGLKPGNSKQVEYVEGITVQSTASLPNSQHVMLLMAEQQAGGVYASQCWTSSYRK